MLQSLKVAKRRSVQKAVHLRGKAEPTLYDPDFDLAVQRFYALEKQFSAILTKLKEARKMTERYCVTSAALAAYMSVPFSNPESKPEAPSEPTEMSVPPSLERGSRASQSHASFRTAAMYNTVSVTIAPTLLYILQRDAIDALAALMRNHFPGKRRQISAHNGLGTDVESYRRRVKALQDKGKEGNDPKLITVSNKLQKATANYNSKHEELLNDLNRFYADRFQYLEPIYATWIATQLELHGFVSDKIKSFSSGPALEEAKQKIRLMIEEGGPPEPTRNTENSSSGMFFSKLQRKKKKDALAVAEPMTGPTGDLSEQEENPFPSPRAGNVEEQDAPGFVAQTEADGPAKDAASAPPAPTHQGEDEQPLSPLSESASAADGALSPSSPQYSSNDDQFSPEPLASPGFSNSGDDDKEGIASPSIDSQGSQESIPCAQIDNDESSSQNSKLEKYVAAFPFEGPDENDLSFAKGDVITITRKIDEGWWQGELDGRTGLVPTTYLVLQ